MRILLIILISWLCCHHGKMIHVWLVTHSNSSRYIHLTRRCQNWPECCYLTKFFKLQGDCMNELLGLGFIYILNVRGNLGRQSFSVLMNEPRSNSLHCFWILVGVALQLSTQRTGRIQGGVPRTPVYGLSKDCILEPKGRYIWDCMIIFWEPSAG